MAINAKPDGYASVTPYLIVNSAARAIEYYKSVFGAVEVARMVVPDSERIAHAEVRIGDSPVMLADEFPELGIRCPMHYGGTPVGLLLYVEDCDAVFHAAIAGGATIERPLADQFYGDRNGILIDPFGHKWTIATHKRDVPDDELQARFEES